ncbi:MAG: cyclic lactone autoinducer peptide [Eubacteriales bacterium]
MNKFLLKYSNHLVAFAVIVSTYSVSVACGGFFNQPKVPDAVKKLRKF